MVSPEEEKKVFVGLALRPRSPQSREHLAARMEWDDQTLAVHVDIRKTELDALAWFQQEASEALRLGFYALAYDEETNFYLPDDWSYRSFAYAAWEEDVSLPNYTRLAGDVRRLREIERDAGGRLEMPAAYRRQIREARFDLEAKQGALRTLLGETDKYEGSMVPVLAMALAATRRAVRGARSSLPSWEFGVNEGGRANDPVRALVPSRQRKRIGPGF